MSKRVTIPTTAIAAILAIVIALPIAAATLDQTVIGAALDDFHDAAAKADGPRYFSHFAPNAIYLGTDATERWTLDEFRAFAEPYFRKGKGWSYMPKARHVTVAKDGRTAWFDEILWNEKYGTCRSSGVMLKIDGAWKIAQYNLSIPIPNALTAKITKEIAASTKK